MDCYKCGKDMGNPDGFYNIRGVAFRVSLCRIERTPDRIDYNNKQLGKYSDGNGECNVAICQECHIDNQFGVSRHD